VASGTRSQLWFLEPYIAYRFPNDDGVTLVTAIPARPKAREWKTDPEAVMTRLFEGLPRAPSVRAQIIWAKERSMRTVRRKHGTALLSQPSASRCAQTLIDVTEKNVPPIQVGNFHRGGGSKKAETDARSFIVLAGNLVREEDRRFKKGQNRRSAMQSKVQIDQALPRRRRPHLSRPRQQ
jgi:hypothetical protein